LRGSFSGTPYESDDFSVSTPESITVNFPRVGTWIVMGDTSTGCSVTFTVKINTTVCPKNFGGPNCAWPIHDSNTVFGLNLAPNQTAYFMANVSFAQPLVAAARSDDGLSVPQIVASLGQLPDIYAEDDLASDFNGCTQSDCAFTNRIVLDPIYAEQYWFVAVHNPGKENNFSVWFYSVCPPDCSIRGTCTTSGPQTGLCVCLTLDFSGPDCGTVTINLALLEWLLIAGGALVVVGILAALSVVCLRSSRPEFRSEYEKIQ